MNKEFMIMSLIALTIFFMAGLWAVDIGASALVIGVSTVEGFSFLRTPSQHYHLGLVTATVAFFIMTVITVKLLFERESNEQEKTEKELTLLKIKDIKGSDKT